MASDPDPGGVISDNVAHSSLLNAPLPVPWSPLLVRNGDDANPGIIQVVDEPIGKLGQKRFSAKFTNSHPEVRERHQQ